MAEKEYQATFLPVFLVVDTSVSMGEEQLGGTGRLIDVANQLVPMIVEKCRQHPTLDQKLRLSLIRFNSDASVVIPLGEADTFASAVPALEPQGNTDFGAAFEVLYTELNSAVQSLRTPEVGVYRPTAFFITDGYDNGDTNRRDQAWAALTDPGFKYRPNFFTFGVADADTQQLKQYKSGRGLVAVAKDPAKAVESLTEVMGALVRSIVSSSIGGDPTGNIELTADDFDPNDWDLLE
jgi:uncharacterized protein YegL